jgi:poly(3-hydroxybutyrate) depolymerase
VSVGVAVSSVATGGPASASTCSQVRSTLEDIVLTSRIAGRVPVRVYLPPCCAAIGRAFPLSILLHGSPGSFTDWTTELGVNVAFDAGIRSGSLPPMIVAMPDGGVPETQQPYAASGTFEAEIMTELLPALERRFCISGRPADHAIGGFSRGGWWALEIAFRHPSAFAAVGGHSAFLYAGAGAPPFDPYVLARSVTLPPGGPLRLLGRRHHRRTPATGAASMVFYRDGHVDIVRWGTAAPEPDVAAVRQNLVLLVDNGVVSPLVNNPSTAAWGTTYTTLFYVWRTALGIRADGSLVFAIGPALNVGSLARIIHAAGAVRAIELDINPSCTHFMTYTHPSPGEAVPHLLTETS